MLKNRKEREDFIDDTRNWEMIEIPTLEGARARRLRISDDMSIIVIEVEFVNEYVSRIHWCPVSMKRFHHENNYFGYDITKKDLVDYLTSHKKDKYIKDFEMKGDGCNESK